VEKCGCNCGDLKNFNVVAVAATIAVANCNLKPWLDAINFSSSSSLSPLREEGCK